MRRIIIFGIMFLTSLAFLRPSATAQAQASPSPGCSAVNAGALNLLFFTGRSTPSLAWTQGEVITATFVNDVIPNIANLNLLPIGGTVVSAPLPSLASVTLSEAIPTSTTGVIRVVGNGIEDFASITTTCTPVAGPPPLPPEVGGPGPVCPGTLDGRINNDPALDCAAPVAIYPAGSVDIYAINPDTSAGTFVTRVEFDPASDTTRTLYQGSNPFTGQPIVVTELPGGIIQVNTAYADGKPYIVQWPADDPTQLVHLAA